MVTVPPVTQPPVTAPTAPPATTPAITDPPATNPPATFPVQTEPVFTDCPHHYDLIDILPATCVSSEIQVYRCSQCSGTEHRAVSEPLGHRFNLRAICTRCGEADPGPIELIIIVKDKKNNKLPGVTVHVFFDGTEVATGTTDTKGEARVYVDRLQTYQVTLSDLPANIIANSSYTFSSKQASIPLAIQPIRDPLDHSLADYQKGSTMADFTLTDSDGNLYQLYDLLAEKKLVILDFWYCSCTPCKKEFPYFDAALDRYGSQIELLALNPLDSLENILSIRQELGSKFPMLRDTVNLYKGFAVTSYPVTVFIGSDGQILAIHNGAYDSQEQLFKDISKYLK